MSSIGELKKSVGREEGVFFIEAQEGFPVKNFSNPGYTMGLVAATGNSGGGRLVLGMKKSAPHNVVGTDFAIGHTGSVVTLVNDYFQIGIDIEELNDRDGRVVVMNVPPRPAGRVLRYENIPLVWSGNGIEKMCEAEYLSVLQETDYDFSANICSSLTLPDLDEDAQKHLRTILYDNTLEDSCNTASTEKLLSLFNGRKVSEGLTYTTLILLGSPRARCSYVPTNEVVVEDRRKNVSVTKFNLPLVTGLDTVAKFVCQKACSEDVAGYDYSVIRELLLNAFIHKDYLSPGQIRIYIYDDYIDMENPGGLPIGVDINMVLSGYRYPRNRMLAQAVRTIGLTRGGKGLSHVMMTCIRQGRRIPEFSVSECGLFRSRIHKGREFGRLCGFFEKIDIELNFKEMVNIFNLFSGREGLSFPDNYSRLLEHDFVERAEDGGYILGREFFELAYNRFPVEYDTYMLQMAHTEFIKVKSASSQSLYTVLKSLYTKKECIDSIEEFLRDGILELNSGGRGVRYCWKYN